MHAHKHCCSHSNPHTPAHVGDTAHCCYAGGRQHIPRLTGEPDSPQSSAKAGKPVIAAKQGVALHGSAVGGLNALSVCMLLRCCCQAGHNSNGVTLQQQLSY